MKQEIIDLIQGEVDGMNSPAQQSELSALCDNNPEIQRELDAAVQVGALLNKIEERTPSIAFTRNVMAALPTRPSWLEKQSKPASFWSYFKLPSRPSLVLAYGIAAGALFVFALSSMIGNPLFGDPTAEGASATMAPMENIIFDETVGLKTDNRIHVLAEQGIKGVQIQLLGSIPASTVIGITIEQPGQEPVQFSVNPEGH